MNPIGPRREACPETQAPLWTSPLSSTATPGRARRNVPAALEAAFLPPVGATVATADPPTTPEAALLFRRLGHEPAIRHGSVAGALSDGLAQFEPGQHGEALAVSLTLPGLGQVELGLERRGELLEVHLLAAERRARLWIAENAKLLERRLFKRDSLKVSFIWTTT